MRKRLLVFPLHTLLRCLCLISFAFPLFLRGLIIPDAMASRHGGLCLYIKSIPGFTSPSVVFPGET